MATARNSLLTEILTITKQSYSGSKTSEISKVLNQYRVQAKSNVELRSGSTARQFLSETIILSWQNSITENMESKVKTALDSYRMQLKRSGLSKKDKSPKAVELKHARSKVIGTKGTKKRKTGSQTIQLSKNVEPLAGGPKKRQSSRGKCPKCNSLGVVLAQSSGGDGYFSCIYCGFQAYQSAIDSELNWPLAAELLGRCFDDGEGRE